MLKLKVLTLIVCSISSLALACPNVGEISDFNCNSKAKVVVTGDSIVYGQGDTANNGVGGYVKRFSAQFSDVTVTNLGVTAITTNQLLRKFKESGSKFMKAAKGADLVVIDAGRNDCRTGQSTLNTLRDLRRLVKLIRTEAATADSEPSVVLAMQIPNRNYRRACIDGLNRKFAQARSVSLPFYLRFDQLSSGILSADGLHPNSTGYAVMAAAFKKFIKQAWVKLIEKSRPDSDNDQIYDYFESVRYGTNATLADTDGDSKSDGQEVFETGTDPLVAD